MDLVEIAKGLPSALRNVRTLGTGTGGAQDYIATRTLAHDMGRSSSAYLSSVRSTGLTSAGAKRPQINVRTGQMSAPAPKKRQLKRLGDHENGALDTYMMGRQLRADSRRIQGNLGMDSWLNRHPNWRS